jgi:phospholipase D1/2
VREVEALFHDMIGAAEHAIYIENQYLTCCAVGQALCRRLRERPQLEVLIVAPHTPDTWLESHTMRNGRIRFRRMIEQEGFGDRVRLLYPQVRSGEETTHTMVHSKVMIVDDRLLRVGSANLNNRSMGTDTECDLTIEAHRDAERAAIRKARAQLLADHCGVTAEEAAQAIDATSLIAAATSLSGRGHSLQPIEDGEPDEGEFAEYIEAIADPDHPLEGAKVLAPLLGDPDPEPRRHSFIWLKLAGVVLAFVALAIAWQFPPLSTIARPETVGPMLQALAAEPWALLLVLGVYVIGGLIAFPVLLLIAATAAAFGPLTGLLYAAAGALASATVTYAVGVAIGRDALRAVIGPRLKRVQSRIVRGGVLTIAAIRLVPIAPFTVVNLVAGASEIRFSAFIAGTVLGMAPGLIVMSALGHQIMRIISAPSGLDIALLAAVVAAWIALAGGVQVAAAKFGRRS